MPGYQYAEHADARELRNERALKGDRKAMKTAIAAVIVLMLAGAALAGVNNVSLRSDADPGFTGTATIITGQFGGATPYTSLEVNARLSGMPSSGMICEAWLVDKDSTMKRSLGVLDGSMLSARTKMASFKPGSPWDSIAITMEPADDTDPMPGKIIAQGDLPGRNVMSSDWAAVAVLPENEMFQQQLAMQRWDLTSDQFMALRMDGLMYSDINLVSNIASRCNRTPTQVAADYMMWGGNLSRLADTCNMTVAQLLMPVPMVAVAGSIQEMSPESTTMIPGYYLKRPNGQVVVSRADWMRHQSAGYTWREVAMAANIAKRTGISVGDILRINKVQGKGFSQIALDHGLRPSAVMDVSRWPWERGGGMETMVPVKPEPMPSEMTPETTYEEIDSY